MVYAGICRAGSPRDSVTCDWTRLIATSILRPNGNRRFGLIFNRMSPSAWTRGNAHAMFYTLRYLAHLERLGTREW